MFEFKQFTVDDSGCGMKISTDSVLLGAWFLPQVAAAAVVIDAGSGSGVLSLMAAQCCPRARVTAVEIDPVAASVGSANVSASQWRERIEVVEGDFSCVALPSAQAIISNPPYFTETLHAPDAARALARHQTALTYQGLLNKAADLLTEDGLLGLVAPAADEERLTFAAALAGLPPVRICRVRTSARKSPKRILCAFGRKAGTPVEEELLMGSDEYRTLVFPFYTKIH